MEFRVDKTGVIHAPVGKISFANDKLLENASTLIKAVMKAKPAAAKGKYVKSATVCSTMGPGVPLDVTNYNAEAGAKGAIPDERRKTKQKDLEAPARGAAEGAERLRHRLREAHRGAGFRVAQDRPRARAAMYQVVKNTLAEKASEGLPAEPVLKGLKGMSAVAYTTGDPGGAGQGAARPTPRPIPTFTFKAGVVEGRAIDVKQIDELANMPSKEEIYAKLLYLINAPAQRMVTVINGVGRNLAVVVDQGVQGKQVCGLRPGFGFLPSGGAGCWRLGWAASPRSRLIAQHING